jgi:hypothetical protein
VILQRSYPVEPWSVSETTLDLSLLAQSESLFALSNGHIGLCGNLDEGEPYGIPGTYLNSFYEKQPLPYAEAAYGVTPVVTRPKAHDRARTGFVSSGEKKKVGDSMPGKRATSGPEARFARQRDGIPAVGDPELRE